MTKTFLFVHLDAFGTGKYTHGRPGFGRFLAFALTILASLQETYLGIFIGTIIQWKYGTIAIWPSSFCLDFVGKCFITAFTITLPASFSISTQHSHPSPSDPSYPDPPTPCNIYSRMSRKTNPLPNTPHHTPQDLAIPESSFHELPRVLKPSAFISSHEYLSSSIYRR